MSHIGFRCIRRDMMQQPDESNLMRRTTDKELHAATCLLGGAAALAAASARRRTLAQAQTRPAAPAPAPASGERRSPNIIVIWGDDVGCHNISAYNRGLMGFRTPNIDRVLPPRA